MQKGGGDEEKEHTFPVVPKLTPFFVLVVFDALHFIHVLSVETSIS